MPRKKTKAPLAKKKPDPFSKRLELFFLFLFVCSRTWLFFAHRGEAIGWDTSVHLEMLSSWPWSPGMWDIQSHFYAYHPPLAFLLAKLVSLLGFDPVTSVQVVSTTASMIGFLFLRESLKFLQTLWTWQGLFFLYVTSSLPIQMYLARSINMDVVVYAEACAVVYFSLRIFFVNDFLWTTKHLTKSILFLLLSLLLGLFTKYSGILLLGIPCLLAYVSIASFPSLINKKVLYRVSIALCIALTAAAMAFPYYYGRYYMQVGEFFPTNMDLEHYDKQTAINERVERDQHLSLFFRQLFWGTSADSVQIQDRDQKNVRMLNTWKDLWSALKYNVHDSAFSLQLSSIYANVSLLFLFVGCICFFLTLSRWTLWDRFGFATIVFSLVEIALLISYSYKYPHALGVPNKGIYIAPALFGFGYILTFIARVAGAIRFPKRIPSRITMVIAILFLGGFITLNAMLPVS